jgi:hypothetical protein
METHKSAINPTKSGDLAMNGNAAMAIKTSPIQINQTVLSS